MLDTQDYIPFDTKAFLATLPKTPALPRPPKTPTPKEQIKRMEAETLQKGWTHEQLWQESKRYDQKGLVCFLTTDATITEVTRQHITFTRPQRHGHLLTAFITTTPINLG